VENRELRTKNLELVAKITAAASPLHPLHCTRSTTEDTEERRFKPEEKYRASASSVSSVVESCVILLRA
jgi:hypothetical protein